MTYSPNTSRQRIYEMVEAHRGDGCLLWHGRLGERGVAWCHKTPVHRLAYEKFIGPIPPRHVVRRDCANNACFAVKHLRLVAMAPKRATPPKTKRVVMPLIIGDEAFIPLTQGKVAVIDAADAEMIGRYLWHACRAPGNKDLWYARRTRSLSEMKPGVPAGQSMHQLLLEVPEGKETDHRNGNGLDNRRCNLRPATHSQNMYNRRWATIKGVTQRSSGMWAAQICTNRHVTHLGYFWTKQEAADAYDRAALKYHGEFASLNKDQRK